VILAAACVAPVVNLYYTAHTNEVRARAVDAPAPLWKVPLGPVSIEQMQLLTPDRLFVALRRIDSAMTNLDYLLVDTVRGEVLWRYTREPDGEYRIVFATADSILFSRQHRGGATLTALDAASGRVRWTRPLGPFSTTFLPLVGEPLIVAIEQRASTVRITAHEMSSGSEVWRREFPVGASEQPPLPVVTASGLVCFFNGTTLLANRDGSTAWEHSAIRSAPEGPPPQLTDGFLVLIDGSRTLQVLESASGRLRTASKLDAALLYTNIYPLGDAIYLRAESPADKTVPFRIIAIRRSDGRVLWSYADREASVSGLVEKGRRLYFATSSRVVALDSTNGKQLFSSFAATSGRTYPVQVREAGGKIVFIGELVTAAFDPVSGKQLYRFGITPVTDMDGLDLLIKRDEKDLAARQGAPTQYSWSEHYRQEAVKYQNLSNANFRLGTEKYGQGKYWEAKKAYNQSQIDSAFSKASSQIAFHSAMYELSESMSRAFKTAEIQGTLAKNRFLRESLLSAYDAAEAGDYVFRPDQKESGFTGLSFVHLPSGKVRHSLLSPSYQEYGIWNLVDIDRGIIYHHGLGMDPSGFVFAEPFTSYRGLTKVRQYNSYLIAQKVALPR
jgi:hypothetical protein